MQNNSVSPHLQDAFIQFPRSAQVAGIFCVYFASQPELLNKNHNLRPSPNSLQDLLAIGQKIIAFRKAKASRL